MEQIWKREKILASFQQISQGISSHSLGSARNSLRLMPTVSLGENERVGQEWIKY